MRRTQNEIKEEEEKYKIYQDSGRWFGIRYCPDCKKEITQKALEKFTLIRNIRNADNKKIICLQCSKSGVNNPFFGKKHSEKSKKQNSKSRIGKACGKYNAMFKQEHRESVSKSLKIKYESGDLDFLKKIQSDNAFKNQANGKLNSPNISSAEKEIKKKLEEIGLIVEAQFNINSLRYDLFIKDKNTLIEYNGDYWHCNPSIYKSDYLNKKKNLYAHEIWAHDKKKLELAEKKGYKLFIIWEKDFMFNKENEINKIINNL
jgi:G:T-mismatch repair DNA endonuclease (very short patch repair protein)